MSRLQLQTQVKPATRIAQGINIITRGVAGLSIPLVAQASLAPASIAMATRFAYVLQVFAILLFLASLFLLIRIIIKRNGLVKKVHRSWVIVMVAAFIGSLLFYGIPMTDFYWNLFEKIYLDRSEQRNQEETQTQKINLEQMSKNIPEGWNYAIDDTDVVDYCDQKASFSVQFRYPKIECTTQEKSGPWTHHPLFTLYYYDKFSAQDWEKHNDCAKNLRKFPIAAAAPIPFAESDEYTIMSYSGNPCSEKDTSEIEEYLQKYYQ